MSTAVFLNTMPSVTLQRAASRVKVFVSCRTIITLYLANMGLLYAFNVHIDFGSSIVITAFCFLEAWVHFLAVSSTQTAPGVFTMRTMESCCPSQATGQYTGKCWCQRYWFYPTLVLLHVPLFKNSPPLSVCWPAMRNGCRLRQHTVMLTM